MADYLTDADKQALRTLGYEEYDGKYGYNDDVTKQDYQIIAVTQDGKIVVKNTYTNQIDAIMPGVYTKCTLAPDVPENVTLANASINIKPLPMVDGIEWEKGTEPYKMIIELSHNDGVAVKKLLKYADDKVIVTINKK